MSASNLIALCQATRAGMSADEREHVRLDNVVVHTLAALVRETIKPASGSIHDAQEQRYVTRFLQRILME